MRLRLVRRARRSATEAAIVLKVAATFRLVPSAVAQQSLTAIRDGCRSRFAVKASRYAAFLGVASWVLAGTG